MRGGTEEDTRRDKKTDRLRKERNQELEEGG